MHVIVLLLLDWSFPHACPADLYLPASHPLTCMPLPATDFPAECAALYPEGFRYPAEYLPPQNRITDPALLQPFADWLRPYVVRYNDKIMVSAQAPVAVRRLPRDRGNDNLQSAIQHLKWGKAVDDPSLQASFEAEDILAEAADWSAVGLHPRAIALIRSLPVPFQQTGTALRSLVYSLTALERYEEALAECQRLARDPDITEFACELYQIQQAELLLHLGRRAEAETVLDEGQAQFRGHWSYYGMRAALALADGQERIARMFVLKGGQLDNFHCHKMLWNRHLAPLETFIRAEFLPAEGNPRLYERDSDMQRLCFGIHGALVASDVKTATTLAQALQFRQVYNWQCTDALALALTGLGAWKAITSTLPVLPSAGGDRIQAVMALARWLLDQGGSARDVLNRLEDDHPLPDSARGEFRALLAWHAGGREGPLPPGGRGGAGGCRAKAMDPGWPRPLAAHPPSHTWSCEAALLSRPVCAPARGLVRPQAFPGLGRNTSHHGRGRDVAGKPDGRKHRRAEKTHPLPLDRQLEWLAAAPLLTATAPPAAAH